MQTSFFTDEKSTLARNKVKENNDEMYAYSFLNI